ncbi:MAG: DEAD/DEAH box helicase [Candidatus Micrarchaeota archaeon]
MAKTNFSEKFGCIRASEARPNQTIKKETDEGPAVEIHEPGREPIFRKARVNEDVMNVLEGRGVRKLYSHQAKAIAEARKGRNVVLVAPTASGKTEAYMVPVAEAALEGFNSLLIYPTKALSRDQLERIREFSILGVRADVYDGDTSSYHRKKIRESFPQVLVTNMDMLHYILMNNRLFSKFLSRLRYVVVDEIHSYSGILGSHASNIIKRLKRITKILGAKPRFFACSATIANAPEFCSLLFGERFRGIPAGGAPKPPMTHILLNPNSSYTTASLKVSEKLMNSNSKLLIFGNSHSVVERIGAMAKKKGLPIRVYRGGLSQEERKRIERDFKASRYGALATTSALELGMDIGSVDSVILAGFPGSLTRMRQRVGRAGRKGQGAKAYFVPRDNPLDQYFFENSREYLKGEPESCYVNPANESVTLMHALAMIRDYPVKEGELDGKIAEKLLELEFAREWAGVLIPTKAGLEHLRSTGIRGSAEPIRIYDVEAQKFIGEREEGIALSELFPGAVYLHGGERYESEGLDLERRIAFIKKTSFDSEEYTVASKEKNAEVESVEMEKESLGLKFSYGKVHVSECVHGYVVKDYMKNTIVSRHKLAEPLHYEFDTCALWIDFPEEMALSVRDFGDGLHAMEHITIAMIPALTGADPREVGGLSYPAGRMYLYDGAAGGSGVTGVAFGKIEKIMRMAYSRLRKCKCIKGCPSCILDPQCGNNNRFLSKEAGREIFGEVFPK